MNSVNFRNLGMFKPILVGATLPGRIIACLGAAIAIGLTILAGGSFPLAASDLPVIAAPIGASAVLVFAVPASPLAQPWPVIGGNVISALVGVTTFRLVPDSAVAASIAVGGAILVMSLLRCLHPPGGAAALTAVVGGAGVHAAGYSFAFVTVGLSSIVLILIAIAFHRATAHSYPHRAVAMPAVADRMGLHPSDIDAAIDDMHESFDISREDLDALLTHAERHAIARLGPISDRGRTKRKAI
jgi:CBS-domain-containing membrane protein